MAQRLAVTESFINKGTSVRKVIRFASVANSTWYGNQREDDQRRHNKGRPVPGYAINLNGEIILDERIIDALKLYRSRKEFINGGGYRKLKYYLQRDYGVVVNHKKIYRLCREHNLLLPKRKKRKRKGGRISQNRVVTRPNQLWEVDLKYGYIHGENRFFFILAILDVYSRLIVNYYVGLQCKGKDLVFTLEIGIERYKVDKEVLIIRSDNGSQMTSKVFMEYVEGYGEEKLIHELIPPATPNKNAHIEAFNSILEIEFLQVRYFNSYGQAYEETVDFIDIYNNERIHGSLNYMTPMEVCYLYHKGGELNLKEVRV